jgi:hypothetical protein
MGLTDRRRWFWFAGAALLCLLCLGIWGWFASAPVPDPLIPVAAKPPPGKKIWVPPPAPTVPAPQTVPTQEDIEPQHLEGWTRAHDRADWVRGAVVTCLLPEKFRDHEAAMADMAQGFGLKGRVDVMSRFMMPIEDGRIHMVVTEPDGEAQIQVLKQPVDGESPFRKDTTELAPMNQTARIRWSNAQPGTTVGCDFVWEVGDGLLAVTVRGAQWDLADDTDTDGIVQEPPPFVLVQGCGLTFPVVAETTVVRSEPGPCTLRADRRSTTLPFIISRGEAVSVYVSEGERTEITLDLPPEPPAWQAPDLTELATVADMAGFFGADAVSDAVDEMMRRIASGEWSTDDLAELLNRAREDTERSNPSSPIDEPPEEELLEDEG